MRFLGNEYLVHDENEIFNIFVRSELGSREDQEDSAGIELNDSEGIVVLCDGMGGLSGGKEASSAAVDFVLSDYINDSPVEDPYSWFMDTVSMADRRVASMSDPDSRSVRSGTTIISVLIRGKELYWVSVGDSRAYIYRDGAMVRLNLDHNYKTLLDNKLISGHIDKTEYNDEIKRGESLVSFLGMNGLRYIESNDQPFELRSGDKIVLATDGLYRIVPDDAILRILENFEYSYDAISSITQKARQNGRNVNRDNMTVALIEIK